MITVTIPEWLIWVFGAMFAGQFILNTWIAKLHRKNGEMTRRLVSKLVELATKI